MKRDGNGARVNRSLEFTKLTDGVSDSAVMSFTPSDASVPTVVGRVRDLGVDHMVGMRPSELFAHVYHIPYGPWASGVDDAYVGIDIVIPAHQPFQVRRPLTCYNNAI